MNRIFFLSIAIVVFFMSCTKDKTNTSTGDFSANINGVSQNFTFADTAVLAVQVDSPNTQALYINGATNAADTSGVIVTLFLKSGVVQPGTYSDSTSNYFVAIQYGGNQYIYTNSFGTKYHATVNITSVSGSSVSGTFSATLYGTDGNPSDSTKMATISGGVFNLPLVRIP